MMMILLEIYWQLMQNLTTKEFSQHLPKLAVRIIAAILLTYSGQQPICCHLIYSVDLLARCCKRQLSLILTGSRLGFTGVCVDSC